MGIRRKRIDSGFRDGALARLSAMPIAVDADCDSYVWRTTYLLADRFGLTAYDAVYLELAQRRRLPLATLDKALRAAANALGMTLLGAA
jgi:predicted nucleic acid-binding protein